MTAYRAQNHNINLEVINDLFTAAIARIRADTLEINSIVSNLTSTRQAEIITWFTSDKCFIKSKFGYVPKIDESPSVTFILTTDNQKEKLIGNIESELYPDSQMDEQHYAYVFPYNKRVKCLIREDNPANAYYLYEIIKYALLTIESSLNQTYDFENIMFSGGFANQLPVEGGAWVYEYVVNIDFMFESTIAEIDDALEIEGYELTQTKYIQELHGVPHEDPERQ